MMLLRTASDVLRDARERARLSQQQLAARAGIAQPGVSRYESGDREPSLAVLARLAGAAGFDLELRLVRHARPLSSPLAHAEPGMRGSFHTGRPPEDLWTEAGSPWNALRTRTAHNLFRENLLTVASVIANSAAELVDGPLTTMRGTVPWGIRGFGPKQLGELQRILAVHGLYLRGDEPEDSA